MICIFSNNDRQSVTKTFTPLHYTSPNCTSLHSHLAQPLLNCLPLHFTSHHFTSPHFTSLHLPSLHFISFNFTAFYTIFATLLFLSLHPLLFASLTVFRNILGLQWKVPSASAGTSFQFKQNINSLIAV